MKGDLTKEASGAINAFAGTNDMEEHKVDSKILHYLFEELDRNLPQPASMLIVGGSALALKGLRDTTLDIDCIRFRDSDVKLLLEAKSKLSIRMFDKHWLNFDIENLEELNLKDLDYQVFLELNKLTVMIIGDYDLLALKIVSYEARGSIQDLKDFIALYDTISEASDSVKNQRISERVKAVKPSFSDYEFLDSTLDLIDTFRDCI